MRGEILLVNEPSKKGDTKEGYHWQLPGGKCCDDKARPGACCAETAEETALREFKDETGYDGHIVSLISCVDKENRETHVKYKEYMFEVEIIGGAPLQKDVFGHYKSPRWCGLKALPRNLYHSHAMMIRASMLYFLRKGKLKL